MDIESSPDGRSVRIDLDKFGWDRLSEEAAEQGVPLGALARHAVLYYLAAVDEGEVKRRVPRLDKDPLKRRQSAS